LGGECVQAALVVGQLYCGTVGDGNYGAEFWELWPVNVYKRRCLWDYCNVGLLETVIMGRNSVSRV
jgi:hypothetical protein